MRLLCKTLRVHSSSYYAWNKVPESTRSKEDQRLLPMVKHYWLESGGYYGYRNIHLDLAEVGVKCGCDRTLRLMCLAQIFAQRGYKRLKGYYSGKPDITAPNTLDRSFNGSALNQWWVSDMTYIHTQESFFGNLKKEKIRRHKYKTREEAKLAIFHYIEMFYNPKRRHTHNTVGVANEL